MYLCEMIWFLCKPIIVIGLICIPLIIYFFLIGLFVDKEALFYGYGILGIFAILLLILIRMTFHCKRRLQYLFEFVNENGDIDFSISKDNDEFIIENLTRKIVNRIKVNEIKSVITTKKLVFVKIAIGQLYFFPKTEEMKEMFEKIGKN